MTEDYNFYTTMQQAKIELSAGNLCHNIRSFLSLLEKSDSEKTRFAAVIKSNAYGHGLEEISKICLGMEGVDVLAVNSPEEAEMIRSNRFPSRSTNHSIVSPNSTSYSGFRNSEIEEKRKNIPLLIMGDIPNIFRRGEELADPNYWIMVSRWEEWKFLSGLKPRPRIHLKVDTGMGRLGSFGEDLERLISQGRESDLPLEGIATHFASTEDLTDHTYSRLQLERFNQAIDLAGTYGYRNLIRHSAASASSLLFDEARMDMVRIGISLYGLWPSVETRLSMQMMKKESIELKPVLSWKTDIRHIQNLPTGSYIGYGSTYKTSYPTRLGVIPVGYYEGLDRKLSNNGYFLVHGERAKILGRVCMNMTMIDLTHIPSAKIGDEVVIIGSSQDETLSADTLASWTNTINYETVTKILPHFPRMILE